MEGLVERVKVTGPWPVGSRDDLLTRLAVLNRSYGNTSSLPLIERLADSRSVVILTGQQPGLLGGPLLVALKAASAVHLARNLEAKTGVPVIPVFWNHSDDHDLDEANRFDLVNDGSASSQRLPLINQGRPLRDVMLGTAACDEISRWMTMTSVPPAPDVGEAFSHWFGRCVIRALEGLPIVVVEPREVWPSCRNVLERSIVEVGELGEAVMSGRKAVASLERTPQVDDTEPSQLFLIDDEGVRRRLTFNGDSWSYKGTNGGSIETTEAELLAFVRETPWRLSPNVLLRPVALQAALPCVAHVLGPGEVSYFAQLPELYAWARMPLPAAWPRPHATILTPVQRRTVERLGISHTDLLGSPNSWPTPVADEGLELLLSELRSVIATKTSALSQRAQGNRSLESQLDAFVGKIWPSVERVEAAFRKDAERTAGFGRRDVHALREWIFPKGKPQERVFDPWTLLNGTGVTPAEVLAQVDVLDSRHQVFEVGEEA